MDGPRILMACGSPGTCARMQTALEGGMGQVETVESSSLILEKAQADTGWDLVIIDAQMPDAGAFPACRQLTENPATRHLPVVFVAVDAEPVSYAKRAADAGAVTWLSPGFSAAELRLCAQLGRRMAAVQGGASDGGQAGNAFLKQVGGLSHAVNNPLQALYAAGDLLMLELEDNQNALSLVQDMLENAQRVADLVSQASLQAKQLQGDDS